MMAWLGRRLLWLSTRTLKYGPLAAAAAWIAVVAMPAIIGAPAVATAQHLLSTSGYDKPEIQAIMASADRRENSTVEWGRAILTLRLYEIALAEKADPSELTAARQAAEVAVRKALALSPANGYLWFLLFALTGQGETGLSQQREAFLARSYALSPWEGWIAIRRSPSLMPLRSALPAELRGHVEAEFAVLLKQNILAPLQKIFASADPELRLRILNHMAGESPELRGRFLRGVARELSAEERN